MAYQPLYGEKRCLICGQWRGEHNCIGGDGSDDRDMMCPYSEATAAFYGNVPTFRADNYST